MSPDYHRLWNVLIDSLSDEFAAQDQSDRRGAVRRKGDGSAVSEVDLRVQRLIVDAIAEVDPRPCVVAEEELNTVIGRASSCERIWVVDPIDGTREFIDPQGREYCAAVAVVEDSVPVACLVFCPVLGRQGSEIAIAVDGLGRLPTVNGAPAAPRGPAEEEVSATRPGPGTRPFEDALASLDLLPKTRATSLTLDMARTSIDLSEAAGLGSFRWFHRAEHRLWDALPGLTLARAVGLAAVDLRGRPLLPLAEGLFDEPEPLFRDTVLAAPDDLPQVLEMLREDA